jgi:integrase/recombinase XerD
MKVAIATSAVILFNRRAKTDGTYPLKLRVTYQRDRKYYNIGIDLTEEVWADVQDKTKTRREIREIRDRIAEFEVRAEKIIRLLDSFTFEVFEKRYFQSEQETAKQNTLKGDVRHVFTQYIESLRAENRIETAASYNSALNSLLAYRKRLRFDEVNPEFLRGYERAMILAGKSVTTISIYLRSFKVIFNFAVSEGGVSLDKYPFGKRRYQIPGGRNTKKALTLAEIEKIYSYEAIPGSHVERARDLWLFSYLCNGINIKDICHLRWRNIDGDRLSYVRAKTSRTSKANVRQITSVLTDPVMGIIDKWGNRPESPDDYVFPILKDEATELQKRNSVKNLVKYVNKRMKGIAEALEIDKPVTTYFARHSFATVLKRSGAPIEFISESLGHADLKTTEAYLDSFEDDVKREYAKALLNFKK